MPTGKIAVCSFRRVYEILITKLAIITTADTGGVYFCVVSSDIRPIGSRPRDCQRQVLPAKNLTTAAVLIFASGQNSRWQILHDLIKHVRIVFKPVFPLIHAGIYDVKHVRHAVLYLAYHVSVKRAQQML